MSSKDDAPARCRDCGEPIRSAEEEVWLWNLFCDIQAGPFHNGCAEETLADDPTQWSRTEPAHPDT